MHNMHQTEQGSCMFVAYLFLSYQRSVTPPLRPRKRRRSTQRGQNIIRPLGHRGRLGGVANVVGRLRKSCRMCNTRIEVSGIFRDSFFGIFFFFFSLALTP